MKYGIREICDVVLKAKADMTVGGQPFAKGAPVIYFDSLKTSTMEGAATTVYAQGGRGNARLVAWEGERTVTFTMEDALISELGLSILTGAGVIETKNGKTVNVHTTVKISKQQAIDGYVIDETIVPSATASAYALVMDEYDNVLLTKEVSLSNSTLELAEADIASVKDKAKAILFDFYVVKSAGVKQMEITADSFCGNFYLEASTLFRTPDGKDHPAEFVIPNCKIQSNFTFNMAATGDPSTFTFTIDAFPDYTRFDYTKKVYSIIQIIDEEQPIGDLPSTEDEQLYVTYGPDLTRVEPDGSITFSFTTTDDMDTLREKTRIVFSDTVASVKAVNNTYLTGAVYHAPVAGGPVSNAGSGGTAAFAQSSGNPGLTNIQEFWLSTSRMAGDHRVDFEISDFGIIHVYYDET